MDIMEEDDMDSLGVVITEEKRVARLGEIRVFIVRFVSKGSTQHTLSFKRSSGMAKPLRVSEKAMKGRDATLFTR
jgi:hypothetical protein